MAIPRFLTAGAACALCALASPPALAGYVQDNLAATDAKFGAPIIEPALTDAWGIAIRPAGLGGHFWVAGNGSGQSNEYVGDVNGTPLHQDALKQVAVPGSGGIQGAPTGVAFNQSPNFQITQDHPAGAITNSAKFLFASTDGTISAWTERQRTDGGFDRPGMAKVAIDRADAGSQFFGLGISHSGDKLYAADFGDAPGVRTYGGDFTDLTGSHSFTNPFAGPGAYAPFNTQDLTVGGTGAVFVTYAAQESAGTEIHGAGLGRLARYDEEGNLVAVADDKGLLDSPWGLALAPADFGPLSGDLLVGNFGDGTIVGFDPVTLTAIDYLRGTDGQPLAIEGLWGLVFGNGASLGEADALYFAAGPEDETQGLFGRITTDVPEPASWALMLMGIGLTCAVARRRRVGAPFAAIPTGSANAACNT
jgi:uncharacterized protein (TIGR03118 family)